MIKTRVRGRGTKGWSNNPRLAEVELDRKDEGGRDMTHCHVSRNLLSTSQGTQQGKGREAVDLDEQYSYSVKTNLYSDIR